MQRYFINEDLTSKQQLILPDDDLHHVKKVMRNINGDEIICIDNAGQVYYGVIEDIEIGLVKIDKRLEENNELDVEITLVYALPKGDKFELVLQKATELGVKRIVPIQTKRCVVKMDEQKFAKKITRYRKILKEAAEQSWRNFIPEITNVIKLEHNQFVSTNRNAAVELRITLEAFGTEHKHQIMKALEDEGLSPREVNAKLY